MKEKNTRDMILWIFLVYFLISMLMLGWLLFPFFSIMILAAVVTGMFHPLYSLLLKKMKPAVASLVTCFVIFLVLFVPILFFVGILARESYEMASMARQAVLGEKLQDILSGSIILDRLNQLLAGFDITITGEEIKKTISEWGRTVGLFFYNQAKSVAQNILKFLVNFFFMLLIIFYLLIDRDRLLAFIVDLSPLPDEQDQKLFHKFRDMSGAIMIGNGLGGIIQGFLGGVVFAIFGIPSPILWGVIMALLAFLPIVGIGVVFVPFSIYLFLAGRIGAGIFFIVFYLVLSGVIEYLFKPKLVGQRVQMHTLLVFFSIIGGLKLFGILGIIYGPLIMTGFLTLTDIYHSSYQMQVEASKS